MHRAEFFLLACSFFWGSEYLISKEALGIVSSYHLSAIRFSLATFLLLPILFYNRKDLSIKPFLKNALWLGIYYGLGYILELKGLESTTAEKSGLFTGLFVIITPLIIAIEKKKLPNQNFFIALFLAFIGIFLVSQNPRTWKNLLVFANLNHGDLITIGSAVSFSFYIWKLDTLAFNSQNETLVYLFSVVFISGILSWLLVFMTEGGLVSFFERTRYPTDINKKEILFASVLYLALFPTILSVFLMTKYQKIAKASHAVLIYTLEPVFDIILSWFFLNEKLYLLGGIGVFCILIGI